MAFKDELAKEKNPSIKIIGEYLLTREDIQSSLEKPNKSLQEMWSYILGEAKKQAVNSCAALSDDVVFGLAVHYYDEDDIKVSKLPAKALVTTSDKKEEVKEDDPKDKIIQKLEEKVQELEQKVDEKEESEVVETVKPKKKKKTTAVPEEQLSMFDFLVR